MRNSPRNRAMTACGTTSLKRYQKTVFTNMSVNLKVIIATAITPMVTVALLHPVAPPISP